MTYKLSPRTSASLPISKHEPAKPLPFYSLFKYEPFNKVWRRVSERAYTTEKLAWLVFRSELIKNPLNLKIKMVKIQLDKVQPRKPSRTASARFNGAIKRTKHAQPHWNPAKEMLAKDDMTKRYAPAMREQVTA